MELLNMLLIVFCILIISLFIQSYRTYKAYLSIKKITDAKCIGEVFVDYSENVSQPMLYLGLSEESDIDKIKKYEYAVFKVTNLTAPK